MKNSFAFFFAVLLGLTSFAQPANDTPCNATSLAVNNGCTQGDNTGATTDGYTGSCWLTAESHSVWYSFTATNDSITLSLDYAALTLTDTEVAVYSSSDNTCSGTFSEVGCDEDGGTSCTFCSEVELTGLTVGDTYFVQIDGYGSGEGTFCVSAIEPIQASADYGTSCDLAHQMYSHSTCYDITSGNVGAGNNLTSTNSIDQSCTAADDSNDNGYWMQFDAVDNTTTIDPVDFNGSQTANYFDISVYTGGCGSLIEEDCRSVDSKNNNYSITTTPGETYWIFMTNGSNYSGEIRRLSICGTTGCTAPSNDACTSAIPLTDGTVYSGTNSCATADEALCSGSTENNIWYSWTAPVGWGTDSSAFFTLFNQDCYENDPTAASSGSQVSIYNATETCATISGGTSECTVYTNPNDDENFYAEFLATEGNTYLINIDGFGGDACTFDLQINSTPQPLPVELLNFHAQLLKDGRVIVRWSTASELNNSYFVVERSFDSKSFEIVDRIKGAGNSVEQIDYHTYDLEPYKGVSYYRLKQVDYDGSVTYSHVVPVSNYIGEFKLYPNPSKDVLNIEIEHLKRTTEVTRINVYNLLGSRVYSEVVDINKGWNVVQLDVSDLPVGTYVIRVDQKDKSIWKKFVKN